MARRRKAVAHTEGVNFFIPMVDLMVSAIFIFIIIVMILVMLITQPAKVEDPSDTPAEASSSQGNEVPINPSIIEDVVTNKTAEEILVEDILNNLLRKEGSRSIYDPTKKVLEIRIPKPKKQGSIK